MGFTPVLCLIISVSMIDAYNILILYPATTFSQQQIVMILTEALINRGHHVTAVSPNLVPGLENHSNYTYVDMSFAHPNPNGSSKEDSGHRKPLQLQKQTGLWELLDVFYHLGEIPSSQFKSEAFLKFQRNVKEKNTKFDVVISQCHFIPYMCGMTRYLTGWSTPVISFCTFIADFHAGDHLSLPHPSFSPYTTPFTDRMSLWQKMYNWVIAAVLFPKFSSIIEESAREFFETSYGPGHGALADGCWTNVSLTMTVGNFLYYYPRLTAPNVIELGAMHIRPPVKLPQNLQDWLDGAQKGVVYFSLGSNIQGKSLPSELRANFLRVFSELPNGYRVIWKWEAEGRIPGQSDNILAQKWLPQQSILAHPKVKLFITHGGLQSFQEAVHYGVPTVGIPWFGDQDSNVVKMEASGIGEGLRPHELHAYEKVKSVIEIVLHDESYSVNMKRLSAISQDFTPLAVDKAVFWVEHVARHGGASHLRPSTADSTYFQYFCLDIISVILVIIVVIFYIAVLAVKVMVSVFCPKSNKKLKET